VQSWLLADEQYHQSGWLLALGIVATLVANVAHGWTEGPVGAVVVAWPAASLVGSYELLLWLVRTAANGGAAHEPTSEQTRTSEQEMNVEAVAA
jgi:hypothetical protein